MFDAHNVTIENSHLAFIRTFWCGRTTPPQRKTTGSADRADGGCQRQHPRNAGNNPQLRQEHRGGPYDELQEQGGRWWIRGPRFQLPHPYAQAQLPRGQRPAEPAGPVHQVLQLGHLERVHVRQRYPGRVCLCPHGPRLSCFLSLRITVLYLLALGPQVDYTYLSRPSKCCTFSWR